MSKIKLLKKRVEQYLVTGIQNLITVVVVISNMANVDVFFFELSEVEGFF